MLHVNKEIYITLKVMIMNITKKAYQKQFISTPNPMFLWCHCTTWTPYRNPGGSPRTGGQTCLDNQIIRARTKTVSVKRATKVKTFSQWYTSQFQFQMHFKYPQLKPPWKIMEEIGRPARMGRNKSQRKSGCPTRSKENRKKTHI